MLAIGAIPYESSHALVRNYISKWFFWIPSTELDKYIPLCPHFFAQMYLLWFAFVPLGGIIAGRQKKQDWINFMLSWLLTLLIGFVFFMVLPTKLDRTNLPGVPGGNILEYIKEKNGFSWELMKLMAKSPSGWNECPSFHCVSIIFCYLAVAKRKDVNIFHRIGQLFITISICLSTVFTKQHYFIDIVFALVFCLLSYLIIFSFNPAKSILKKHPNFLIIKKLNWTHEEIIPLDKKNKKDVKIEKVG